MGRSVIWQSAHFTLCQGSCIADGVEVVMPSETWKRIGLRTMKRDSADYNAIIFGCAPPRQNWAWAVYGIRGNATGVEFSLRQARLAANEKIKELGRSEKAQRDELHPDPFTEGIPHKPFKGPY